VQNSLDYNQFWIVFQWRILWTSGRTVVHRSLVDHQTGARLEVTGVRACRWCDGPKVTVAVEKGRGSSGDPCWLLERAAEVQSQTNNGDNTSVGARCWVAWGTDKRSYMEQNIVGEMAVAQGSFYSAGTTSWGDGGSGDDRSVVMELNSVVRRVLAGRGGRTALSLSGEMKLAEWRIISATRAQRRVAHVSTWSAGTTEGGGGGSGELRLGVTVQDRQRWAKRPVRLGPAWRFPRKNQSAAEVFWAENKDGM
jgi:hypothetical protein